MTYEKYLESDAWKKIRETRLSIDDYTCQCCGRKQSNDLQLQTHHLTYRNLFRENPWTDVVSLCDNCHRGVHRILCRRTSETRRGWKDCLPESIQNDLSARGLQ